MDVAVYSTPTCTYCHQLKQYLTQRSIPYRDLDVSRDAAAAAEMVRLTGQQGVPVTVIDGQAIIGYDRRALDEALGRASRPRLGASVADVATMAARGRCEIRAGAFVGQVKTGGIASDAGLSVGDVITSFGGRPVGSAAQLEQFVAGVQPSQRVPLDYARGSQKRHTTLQF